MMHKKDWYNLSIRFHVIQNKKIIMNTVYMNLLPLKFKNRICGMHKLYSYIFSAKLSMHLYYKNLQLE